MIPARLTSTSALPLGRFPTTVAEIEAEFVTDARWAASTTRQEIWGHFQEACAELNAVVPIAWLWLAGSFVTDKMDPDDLDIVFWVEDTELAHVADLTERLLLHVVATNQTRSVTGRRLDTFLLAWHVDPTAHMVHTERYLAYARDRGQWDDFWQRMRSGPKGGPGVREDALQRRGYLEVQWSGGSDAF